jgi:putative Ca2+/H+ antiporter (TMEM165/GDT1 family)
MQGPDHYFGASRALLTRNFGIQPFNSTAMGTTGLSRRFAEALGKSIGVIGASEIGDKTFFIAAIMAMRSSRLTVFAGALSALAAMTVLSALLGWAAPNLISKVYTHYAATILFFFFGFKTLYDAYTHTDEGGSELEEVEKELSGNNSKDAARKTSAVMRVLYMLFSQVFLKAFTLTFLAEWGDRSQIATIGLAAQLDVVGVIIGSIVGHAACTGAAVLGGKHLAEHIDEKLVGVIGGVLFLLFGAHALWTGSE